MLLMLQNIGGSGVWIFGSICAVWAGVVVIFGSVSFVGIFSSVDFVISDSVKGLYIVVNVGGTIIIIINSLI